jgi:hypothetical protein
MRKSRVEQWSRKKKIELVATLAPIVFVMVLVVLLSSHGTRRPGGPKRVEADGATYVACQGVLWLPNERWAVGDTEAWGYAVRYRDARGIDHELHRVRLLHITDLPNDTPECANQH